MTRKHSCREYPLYLFSFLLLAFKFFVINCLAVISLLLRRTLVRPGKLFSNQAYLTAVKPILVNCSGLGTTHCKNMLMGIKANSRQTMTVNPYPKPFNKLKYFLL